MITRKLTLSIAVALFILALAAGLRWADSAGLIGTEDARRWMQIAIGLIAAGYSNVMPKQIGRPRSSIEAETRAQAALRVGGWAFTLAGLAYAALWAFAPLPVADIGSMAVVIAAFVVTFAWCARMRAGCRSADPASADG